jgi:preprotein translocase subunit SecY
MMGMLMERERRIAFTLGALLVYSFGAHIPLPGLDSAALGELLRARPPGGLDSLLFSGGGLRRIATFSLNVVPYVSAAVIVQLATVASVRLRARRKQGAHGRATVERLTRYLTVLLAALQGLGLAATYESIPGLVAYPDWLFLVTTPIILTAGTMLLVWLSAQMTLFGMGNGLALLLIAGVVTDVPAGIASVLELGRRGLLSQNGQLALGAVVVAAVGIVVLMEQGRRHIPVRYAQRQVGAVMFAERSSPLTLKLNNAGLMPVILANWLVGLLAMGASWLGDIAAELEPGRPLYLILYVLFVVFGAFFYTAFVLDPDESAGSLRQHGGTIEGVEPGEATAAHLDLVVSRITTIGAVYLAAVCLLPEVLTASAGVPLHFGGPPLLLVVCTMLDLAAQLRAFRASRSRGA